MPTLKQKKNGFEGRVRIAELLDRTANFHEEMQICRNFTKRSKPKNNQTNIFVVKNKVFICEIDPYFFLMILSNF